jgi:N-acetylneuraminic acid mutarotase
VPGVVRYGAIGFNIGAKGYVGLGWTTASQLNDFYEYDPSLNLWTAKANFPGGARYSLLESTIGNKGYVGTGYSPLRNDWWEYDPVTNIWVQKANQPTVLRQAATGFSFKWLWIPWDRI